MSKAKPWPKSLVDLTAKYEQILADINAINDYLDAHPGWPMVERKVRAVLKKYRQRTK